ncbi:hypothetical protein PSKAS_02540 [Peribacillus sp. N1]
MAHHTYIPSCLYINRGIADLEKNPYKSLIETNIFHFTATQIYAECTYTRIKAFYQNLVAATEYKACLLKRCKRITQISPD